MTALFSRICHAILMIAATSHAASAQAAWHDQFRGIDVQAHYVRLAGHFGDNDEKRQLLLIDHGACNGRRVIASDPVEPLPAGGIPAVPEPHQQEIYYSATRTLTVALVKRYHIDPRNCRLALHEKTVLSLASVVGKCDIDMTARIARGYCDETAHRRASIEATKAWISRQHERIQFALASRGTSVRTEEKSVAGMRCTILTLGSENLRKCIANPASGFAIPSSASNAEYPGLLIDVSGSRVTLALHEIVENLNVSEKLFAIPPDFRIISIPSLVK